ncbi:uncharacterized protein LOC119604600 [Lucilia sericata]|uniref:uncharacterized protein LOC119604600 n=1 Tax=Lucilia sericata TaxID=13632 RepID=UPI0018A856C1|nr:uncharacterized protein LOC119604600 [Lucilia sericata]
MQWAEKCIELNRAADLVDFCQWLEGVRKIANMVSDALPSVSSVVRNKKPLPKNKFALTTNIVQKCAICSGDCHPLTDCQLFKEASVDERWNKARALRLCFSCLKGRHQVNKCFKKQRCGTNNCEKQHHPLLHSTSDQNNKQTNGVATVVENENPRTVVNLHAGTQKSEILFQIIPVNLYGPKGCISIYAFIDDGADATMLEWDIGKEIGLNGKQEKLKLQWLNGHCSSEQTEIVDLSISGLPEENIKYQISEVYLVKNLELPTQSFNLNDINYQSHLNDLPITSYSKIKPQMIISLTHAFLTVPVNIPICPDNNGPIAVKTRLGWVVYGPNGMERHCVLKSVFHSRRQDIEMKEMMRQYFEVESCMVKLDVKPVKPESEIRALDILKSTTKFCDGRYECGLLWKNETQSLPDSYAQSLRRLYMIEKKFRIDPQFEIKYRAKMKHLLEKGYARRLSPEEEKTILPKTFFLPHFAVFNPVKDSLRLVFDAAAKFVAT